MTKQHIRLSLIVIKGICYISSTCAHNKYTHTTLWWKHTHKHSLLWSISSINFFYEKCTYHIWFQASTTKQIRTVLLWVTVQHVVVVPCWHFRTTCKSWNVSNELTLHAVELPTEAQFLSGYIIYHISYYLIINKKMTSAHSHLLRWLSIWNIHTLNEHPSTWQPHFSTWCKWNRTN